MAGRLFSLDTGSGQVIEIGDLGLVNLNSLTSGDFAPSGLEIPVLSAAGLGLLVGLLAMLSLVAMRRLNP